MFGDGIGRHYKFSIEKMFTKPLNHGDQRFFQFEIFLNVLVSSSYVRI